ncbi:MAG: hypothetical protein J1F03_05940 [Oscillospiraceae bacterium]|nr:hypothetical protein [Oscillospiraceae bacterium]
MSYQHNSNLAYDLSLFDRSNRDIREKRAEKPNIKLKEAPSVSKSGSKLKVGAAAVMVFAALCAVNYSNTKKDDISRLYEEQQQELQNALDDNALLQNKLEAMVNTSYIEKYAEETLGMTKVSPSQKKYISVNTENLVKIEQEEDLGFIGRIKSWWDEVLEYIGF